MCSGYDGSAIRQLKTDNTGRLDTLSLCTQYTSPWVTSDNREAIAYRNLDLGTTSSQIGASSNVKIVSVNLANDANAKVYVKLYNSESATASDTPVMTWTVLHDSVLNMEFNPPLKCVNGACLRCTTGLADNDTGAPSTNEMVVNIAYYN